MTGWECALYLENGHLFLGEGLGAPVARGGEAVFNTGLTGYQEVFTDPSYCQQIVVMTYPHIGSTGINTPDEEGSSLCLSGVVARDYPRTPSNWRSEQTLDAYLEKAKIPGIHGVDTREITQCLRNEGAQRALLFPLKDAKGKDPVAYAKELLSDVPAMEGLDLVSRVSCKKPYVFAEKGDAGTAVVYDYGVKTNILRMLRDRGFRVHVVPYNTPHQDVLAMKPTFVTLTNGPGDPATVPSAVQEIQPLIGKIPLLAICMGHQLLGRALGAKTYKLKFGHHGVNHPVKDLTTGRIHITSQNHGFCVREEDLKGLGLAVSHVNLNDHTVEGFVSEKMKLYSVQFHPESAPGPHDAGSLFDNFIKGFLR